METRLSGGDVALEPQGDDSEESYAPIAYLADDANEPTRVIEAKKRDWLAGDGIALALDALDPRSRRIVEERWLKVNDDSSGGMTLHDLAGRIWRQRRADPPDRGRGDEEDEEGARAVGLSRPCDEAAPPGPLFHASGAFAPGRPGPPPGRLRRRLP